jgi:hypothetical protein
MLETGKDKLGEVFQEDIIEIEEISFSFRIRTQKKTDNLKNKRKLEKKFPEVKAEMELDNK